MRYTVRQLIVIPTAGRNLLFLQERLMAGREHRTSSGLAPRRRLDQAFRRDAEPLLQAPDHLEGERALAVEDLVIVASWPKFSMPPDEENSGRPPVRK
jgi:hypothetical protein